MRGFEVFVDTMVRMRAPERLMIVTSARELMVRGLWERACVVLHADPFSVRDGRTDPDERIRTSWENAVVWFPGSFFDVTYD